MKQQTEMTVRMLLKSDASVTEEDIEKAVNILKGKEGVVAHGGIACDDESSALAVQRAEACRGRAYRRWWISREASRIAPGLCRSVVSRRSHATAVGWNCQLSFRFVDARRVGNGDSVTISVRPRMTRRGRENAHEGVDGRARARRSKRETPPN